MVGHTGSLSTVHQPRPDINYRALSYNKHSTNIINEVSNSTLVRVDRRDAEETHYGSRVSSVKQMGVNTVLSVCSALYKLVRWFMVQYLTLSTTLLQSRLQPIKSSPLAIPRLTSFDHLADKSMRLAFNLEERRLYSLASELLLKFLT